MQSGQAFAGLQNSQGGFGGQGGVERWQAARMQPREEGEEFELAERFNQELLQQQMEHLALRQLQADLPTLMQPTVTSLPQGVLPMGTMGAPGLMATMGAAGSMGTMGPAGPMGAAGLMGAPGSMGTMGPAGPMGAMGPVGNLGTMGPVGMGTMGALGLTCTLGSAQQTPTTCIPSSTLTTTTIHPPVSISIHVTDTHGHTGQVLLSPTS